MKMRDYLLGNYHRARDMLLFGTGSTPVDPTSSLVGKGKVDYMIVGADSIG